MKKWILIFLLSLSVVSFSELAVTIVEPIRFSTETKGRINTTLAADEIVGTGKISIKTKCTDLEEYKKTDKGKKIKIKFSKKGILTNGNHWIKVERFEMAKADTSFTLDDIDKPNENKFYNEGGKTISITAVIKKSELNFNQDSKKEGIYEGVAFIVLEEYGRPLEKKGL